MAIYRTYKYLVFTDGTCDVFEENDIHLFHIDSKIVKSAGFVDLKDGKVIKVYGESQSLCTCSKPEEDKPILEKFFKKENGGKK